MNDEGVASTLASYLPEVVLRRLRTLPGGQDVAAMDRHWGGVLFADVNGFTALSEKLAKQGAVGAEKLSKLLNDYFGRAVNHIDAAGGDVVRFAGDAILAVFPAVGLDDLKQAALQTAQCAIELRHLLRDAHTEDGTSLTLKIGIGAGQYCVMHLGGEFARREFFVAGPAFDQAFAATEGGLANQVIVSPKAWTWLNNEVEGMELPGGNVLVTRESTSLRAPTAAEPPPLHIPDKSLVRAYVSGAVTAQLEAGQEAWLAELRVLTSLFIHLPDLGFETPLELAQTIFQSLQQELYRYEGTVNKLNVDEKGTSLLAAMGLPPLAHEDDARRAVVAAMAIHRRLGDLGLRCSIGMATGRVFCGSIGNDRRREYAIIGDTVNLSARLMQAANGHICCDNSTRLAACGQIEFEPVAELDIKGKSRAVQAYLPVRRRGSPLADPGKLVARQAECDQLRNMLQALVDGHAPGGGADRCQVLVIEGEPGIGKSGLVRELLSLASQLNVHSLVGGGDSIEIATLYHCWKPILNEALAAENPSPTPVSLRKQLLARLAGSSELLDLAPLLSSILPIDLPDNETTRHMTGRVRGENTRYVVRQLLIGLVQQQPTVIVVEDIHWLDSASWSLVEDVARDVGPLLLVLTGRPIIRTDERFESVLQSPAATWLSLDRLTREQTGRLLAQRLSLMTVSESLTNLVYEKTGGNPLFSEQLGLVIREIMRDSDEGINFENGLHAEKIEFPDTLHGAITGTIDRLEPSAQLAVKVAGVIGRRFLYQLLHDTYPVVDKRPHVRDYLAAGLYANLMDVVVPEAPVTYAFRHAITQQVAYDLLLFEQRRQLHRSIAEWYEASQDLQSDHRSTILAHHWEQAGAAEMAMRHAEIAAEAAYQNGAHAESIRLFQAVLRLDRLADQQATDLRRAGWERRLGESFLGMGNLAQSKVHLENALADLDRPVPDATATVVVSLLLQVGVQLFRRATPRFLRELRLNLAGKSKRRPELLEAAKVYERLGEVFYLANDRERLVHSVLGALNLAERAGRSPQLARAYANSSFAAGLGGLHRLARGYVRDAWNACDENAHPSAAAWVAEVTGVYQLGMGQLRDAQRTFSRAIAIYERLGDWQHWGENMAATAQAAYLMGDVAGGETTWKSLYERAKERGDDLQLAWGLNGRAEAVLRRGQSYETVQAVTSLQQALFILTTNADRVSKFGTLGLLATAQFRCGQFDAAAAAADDGLALSDELASPTGYYTLNGYFHVAQTYLSLWELGYSGGTNSMAALATRACRALDRYAAIFPLGRPSALYCRGLLFWLGGRERASIRAWQKSASLAATLQMPLPQGLATWQLGRHLPGSPSQRRQYHQQATAIFERLGAQYELEQAKQVAMPRRE